MSIRKPKVYWPLTVVAGVNNKFSVAGYISGMYIPKTVVTIPAATYYSAAEYAAAIQAATRTAVSDSGLTCTIDSVGRMQWTVTTFTMSAIIRDTSPSTDRNALPDMGYNNGAAGNVVLGSSEYQVKNGWWSPTAVAEDSATIFDREMHTSTRAIGGQVKVIDEGELTERIIRLQFLTPQYTYIAGESATLNLFNDTTGAINSALENWWRYGNARFRYWQDASVEGTYNDYSLDQDSMRKFAPRRQFIRKALYEHQFRMLGFVA